MRKTKPDTSLAIKTRHFNLLTTALEKQRWRNGAASQCLGGADQIDQTSGETAFRLARDEGANPCRGRRADFTPPVTLAPRALHGVVERVFRRRDGDVGSHSVIDDLRVAADIGDDR